MVPSPSGAVGTEAVASDEAAPPAGVDLLAGTAVSCLALLVSPEIFSSVLSTLSILLLVESEEVVVSAAGVDGSAAGAVGSVAGAVGSAAGATGVVGSVAAGVVGSVAAGAVDSAAGAGVVGSVAAGAVGSVAAGAGMVGSDSVAAGAGVAVVESPSAYANTNTGELDPGGFLSMMALETLL